MRKPLPVQLFIPSPCVESWDEMTPDARGRFCAHCQKSVIDFTGWSDKALYDFFAKNKGEICGRFHEDQLSRGLAPPPQPHSKLYRIAIALGLTILVAHAYEVQARVMPPLVEQHILARVNDTAGNDTVEIKGQVLDEKQELIIGAVVMLEQDGKTIALSSTDIDGNFSIPVFYGLFEKGNLKLTVQYNGYAAKTVSDITTVFITVQLALDNKAASLDVIVPHMGRTIILPAINDQQHTVIKPHTLSKGKRKK